MMRIREGSVCNFALLTANLNQLITAIKLEEEHMKTKDCRIRLALIISLGVSIAFQVSFDTAYSLTTA